MNSALIDKTSNIVEARFLDLLLSDKLALSKLGLLKENAEQQRDSRARLDIEEQAQERKQHVKEVEASFHNYVSEYFHEELFKYLEQKLDNESYLCEDLLQLDSNVSKLFDMSVAKAASGKQFDDLINQMPWLVKDVLKLVNNPPFRAQNSQRPYVEKVGLAIRYIGIDNIKFALLTYTAKNLLPHSTEPFTDFKNRYWQYALACGNCMRTLSKEYGTNETLSFLLGITHGLGISLVLRTYLRAFDKVRVDLIAQAVKDDRKDIEKVLHALELDPNYVETALSKFSLTTTHIVFRHMKLKFAILLPYLEELDTKVEFDNASPMTKALIQAKTFVQYKVLQKARLIEIDEAKLFLRKAKLNNAVIAELNKVNLSKLNLKPTE